MTTKFKVPLETIYGKEPTRELLIRILSDEHDLKYDEYVVQHVRGHFGLPDTSNVYVQCDLSGKQVKSIQGKLRRAAARQRKQTPN